MDPEPGGAGLGVTKSILKTIPFLSSLIPHPAVPTTLVTHNRVPGILKHPQKHRAYPTPGAAMGEQGWASRAGTAGNATGGSRISFGREMNIDMASGASRGGVCHRGSRESREQESWAQCQAAVAHTAFLERRELVGGCMGKGELQQHQGKEQPHPVCESPAGIPDCEELAQVLPSSLSPSGSSLGHPLHTPSLARCSHLDKRISPQQENPAVKTQPPQKLPVPTLPVPGRAPGQKEQSVGRPG